MFKLSSLQLIGVEKEDGLMISWLPDGLMIEISQSKLEGLRKQYEEQVAILKEELENERKKSGSAQNKDLDNLQLHFMQQSKKLKGDLNKKQKKELDVLLLNLEEVCAKQLIQLQKEHEDDLSIQLQALKVTLEQVHKGELLHVKDEFEQHHLAVVSSLKRSMAELEDRLEQSDDSDAQLTYDQLSIEKLNKKLSNEHNQLVQRISTVLKSDVQSKLENLKSLQEEDQTDSDKQEVISKAEDIRKTLESQREEIVQVRAQLLTDYEMVLQTRTESMTSNAEEVKKLQEEMERIQEEYQQQIKSLQDVIKNNEDREDLRKQLEEEHSEELQKLRTYYEKRIQDVELSFMDEIVSLKARYEISYNPSDPLVSTRTESVMAEAVASSPVDSKTEIPIVIISEDESSSTVKEYSDSCDTNSVCELEEKLISLESTKEESECVTEKNKSYEEEIIQLKEKVQNSTETLIMGQSDHVVDLNNSGALDDSDRPLSTVSGTMSELIIEVEELKQQNQELKHQQELQIDALRQDMEHEHKIEIETMQAESKVQIDIEVKKIRTELTNEYAIATEKLKDELLVRNNEITNIYDKATSDFRENLINNDIDEDLRDVLVQKLKPFIADQNDTSLEQYSIEDSFTAEEVHRLKEEVEESKKKYADLIEGIKEWQIPDEEVSEIIQDKFDMQLELSKSVIREEFDEQFKAQQKKFIERHRRMMDSFTEEREAEAKKLKELHNSELETLRTSITEEYENRIKTLQVSFTAELESARGTSSSEADDSGVHASVSDNKTDHLLSSDDNVDATNVHVKHEQEVNEIRNSYEAKLDMLQKELNDKMEAVILDNETSKSELEEAHRQEIVNLQKSCEEKHQKDLKNMEQKYTAQIEDLEDKHKAELKKLEKHYQEQLEDVRNSVENVQVPNLVEPIQVQEQMMLTSASVLLEAAVPSPKDTSKEQQRTLTLGDTLTHVDGEPVEGDNLVRMLKTDLDHISAERDTIQKVNDHLLALLSDSVKTYFCIEETINKHLGKIVKSSSDARPGSAALREDSDSRPSSGNSGRASRVQQQRNSSQRGLDDEARSATPSLVEPEERSQDSDTFQETSIVSVTSDEGLDLSQRLTENLFTGPDLDSEGEEIINDASQRLHAAVQKLLEMIEQSTNQLVGVKSMHQELLDVLEERNQEAEFLQSKCQETEDRLKEQTQAKEYLALELNKAEGLIAGYTAERDEMILKIQVLEEQKEVIVMDFETTRNRLQDYQSNQHEIEAVKTELQRQQSILHDNAGQELQVSTTTESSPPSGSSEGLILEVTRLNEVKRDLELQMKDLQSKYESRICDLENAGEETEKHYAALLEEYKQKLEDLQLQLESTEKQLKANKQFLEELTNEREQEREDFQREIEKWKKILQDKARDENAQDRLQREVQELSEQLQTKAKTNSEILEKTERLKRDLSDKELTAQDLKELIKQLETELEEKDKSEKQLKQRILKLESDIEKLQDMSDDLAHSMKSTASDHSEKESPVEDQILHAAVATVVHSQLSLDEELRQNDHDNDLAYQKEALQHQVQEQLVQISALKNQLDDFRHRGDTVDALNMAGYQANLQELREQSEKSEREINRLEEINEDLKKEVGYRDIQIHKLESQLHTTGYRRHLDQNSVEETPDLDMNWPEEIKRLKTEVEQKDKLINDQTQQLALLEHSQLSDYSLTDIDREKLRLSLESGANLQQEIGDAITQKVESELASLRHENQALKDVLKQIEEGKPKQGADNSAKRELSDSQSGGETGALSDVLHEKEVVIEHLTMQLDSLEQEVDNLTEFQTKLQEDFDTVQGMLEEKQKEVESLEKDLLESKADKEIMEKYETEIKSLKKELSEKCNTIEESAEELYMLNEKVEEMDALNNQLKSLKDGIQKKEDELKQQTQLTESLQKQVEDLKAALSGNEQEISSCLKESQDEVEATKDQLREISAKLRNKENEVEKLSADIDELNIQLVERLNSSQSDSGSAKEELMKNEEKMKDLKEMLQLKTVEVEKGQKTVELLSEQVNQAESKSKELESTLKHVSQDLEKSQSQNQHLESELTQAQYQIEMAQQQAEEENEEVYEQLDLTKAELKKTELLLKKAQNDLSEKTDGEVSLLKGKDEQIKQLRKEMKTLKQNIPVSSQNADIQGALPNVQIDNERMKQEIIQLEEKLEILEKELMGSQEALEESFSNLRDRDDELERLRNELAGNMYDLSENSGLNGEIGNLENIVALQKKQLEEKSAYIQELQMQMHNFQRGEIAKDVLKLKATTSAAEDEAAKTEEHIKHLHQDILTAKSAVQQMQHESGDTLQYTSRSKSSSTESLDSIQLRDELKKARQQLRELQSKDNSKSLPDMTQEMIRLNKELERSLAELELYRSSATMTAKDFVKKVSELRKELSLENERHIRELESRSDEDIASQFARLQLRHEEEIRDLKQEHKRILQDEVNDTRAGVEKHYKAEINKLMKQHQKQIDRLRVGSGSDDVTLSDSDQSDVYTASHVLTTHAMRRQDGVGQEIASQSTITDDETSSKVELLMQKLHHEGIQMLTLSELQYLLNQSMHGHADKDVDLDTLKAAWDNEKQKLMSSVQAQKDLLSVVQTSQTLQQTSEVAIFDWRSEVIRALATAFAKERDCLLAELRSYVALRPNDDITPIQIMEKKIKNQASHQSSALEQLMTAERQSMLNEIRDLRANANVSRTQNEDESRQYTVKLNSAEDEWSKQEHKLKRQVQLLDYKLQQQQVIYEDAKTSMQLTRSRLTEVTSQLSREKSQTIDLQTANANLEVMMSKIKGTLEREQSRYLSLSENWEKLVTAFEEEKRKTVHLSDLLENEKSKHRQVKNELQNLRSQSEQTGSQKEQVTNELQAVVAREREGRIQASGQVEQLNIKLNLVKQELESQKRILLERDSENEGQISRLQSQLDVEKEQKDEINRKLTKSMEKERTLTKRLQESNSHHPNEAEQATIDELETLLIGERNKVANIQNSLEREKHRFATVSTAMDTEKNRLQEEIIQERATCRQIKKELDLVQMQKLDCTRQFEREKEQVNKLKSDLNKLQEELKVLKERENREEKDRDGERINERKAMRQIERERDEVKMQLHEQELEGQRLLQKIHELEGHLEENRHKEMRAFTSIDKDRIVPSHYSKYESSRSRSRSPVNPLEQTEGQKQLEDIRQRMLYLLLKFQEEQNRTQGFRESSSSGGFENMDHSMISEVLSELQHLRMPLHSEIQEETSLPYSSSADMSHVNGRILSHNAELTNFVSRLTREKLELRNRLMRLEEDLVRQRQIDSIQQDRGRRPYLNSDVDHESELLIKRTEWSREKLSLQLALNESEKEIERLQRQLRITRDKRSEVDISSGSDNELDPEKMQRLYGKYLRAESFRKNLMYQKKYLLILLGGYQESECETLAMIARLGVYPRTRDVQRRSRHLRPYTLFRSAARVIIAVFRMKYLSKKWKCARRVGSPVAATNIHLLHGYVPSSNGLSPSRPFTSSVLPESSRHESSARRLHTDLPANVSIRSRTTNHSPHQRFNQSSFYTPPTQDRERVFVTPVEARSSSVRRNLMTELSLPQNGATYNLTNGEHSLHDDYILRLENLQHRLQDFRPGHRTDSLSSVRPRK